MERIVSYKYKTGLGEFDTQQEAEEASRAEAITLIARHLGAGKRQQYWEVENPTLASAFIVNMCLKNRDIFFILKRLENDVHLPYYPPQSTTID